MNEFRKKIFNQIASTDPKAIGNIIYALMGCQFCQAFGIDKDCCKSKHRYCTDFIDDFIKNYYLKKQKELDKKSIEANKTSLEFWDNNIDDKTWNDV